MLRGVRRPARLVLEPSGLTHELPFRRRHWPWPDVGALRIIEDDETDVISFTPRGLATAEQAHPRLSGDWPLPLDKVCQMLNEARERWG